ncbi:cation transporter [Campylobacter sp. faydin G-140]|uniref:cation diffusion facilitator family transporter n=1 Tax=Campylobacter anatolicus TaxID=2829105 RepID=UPI001B961168|nr:cation diffusion facilitator family transporter [Campylobacter anatolicus]MBR8462055.1 cation transporter [Campylobacter anatolicus]MBR8464858.1 cation transporter [Campylobacter anatolicus]
MAKFDYEINKNLSATKQDDGEKVAIIVAGTTAFTLSIIKFIVGFISGSLSVMGSAIDSALDCIVSVLNFFALKKSRAPANFNFNFGYTKLEAIAALFEGIFIIFVAVFIFYESILKFKTPNADMNAQNAIYVMIFSLVITAILIIFLNSVAKRTNNLIIKADALHYKSDFYTNLAIIIALVIINFTGLVIIDAIFGVIISGYIAHSAINLIKESFAVLLDKALSGEMIEEIKRIISAKNEILSYHYLTSRYSGNICFLSVHLVFGRHILLFDAHTISDEIESEIKRKFSQFEWEITFHFDPCDDRFGECRL